MSTDFSIHKNISLLHFSMLNQRLLYEETREAIKESAKLWELCERYVFERYLDIVEEILEVPVDEFEAELVEMIVKDFKSIDSSVACYGYNKSYLILDEIPGYGLKDVILQYWINREIFENKISPYDPQIKIMIEYFVKHVSDN